MAEHDYGKRSSRGSPPKKRHTRKSKHNLRKLFENNFYKLPQRPFLSKIGPLCRDVSEMSCKIWRILPGIFLEGFLGMFSHEDVENNPARESAEKFGGSTISTRENPFCPQPALTISRKQAERVCANWLCKLFAGWFWGGLPSITKYFLIILMNKKRLNWEACSVTVSRHMVVSSVFRRVKSTPDPDTFEKYRDTPPISIAILLQKYALLLAESSIYTTNLYHDTPPICISMLLQKY